MAWEARSKGRKLNIAQTAKLRARKKKALAGCQSLKEEDL